MLQRSFQHTFMFYCLLSVAFLLPLSVWLVSVIAIIMILFWIIGGDYSEKTKILRERKELLLLPALFLLYIIWLFNTSDFGRALNEFRLKAPLIIFPLFASSYGTVSNVKMRAILLFYVSGCVVAVALGFAALAGLLPVTITDSRDLALFVPSIRLSIIINLAIFSSLYLCMHKETGSPILRIALVMTAVLMTLFLFRLLSVTGLLIFILISAGSAVYFLFKKQSRTSGLILIVIVAASVFILISGMSKAWWRLHNPVNPEINNVIEKTMSGNTFSSYQTETLLENGYLVWNNVCEKELRNQWNTRSSIPYDSRDSLGNEVRVTLIRYISFLGMTKDSSAVASLTDEDISNIERGFANRLYADVGSPSAKWYEIAWQADRYDKGGNPSGHSITQRMEFYRAAFAIIKRNAFTGVGTGDVRKEFDKEYACNKTPLTENFRLMAHNQYLTFAITFGIPGALLALILMLSPVLLAWKRVDYLFVVFVSIIFISMFNDDTFESTTGATFFSYFYTLFLLIE